jgi:2,3-bisphosphoglycerate-independent phosphoglycerate mutase
VFDAAKSACEVVDECVGRLIETTLSKDGSLLITADHGNAERMWNTKEACPHTAHTNFDVPLHLVGARWRNARLRKNGRLADIGPTILEMMGVPAPEPMTGRSLIEH